MANVQNVLNALDPYNGEPEQLEKFIAAAEQEFGPNWTDTILQEMADIPPLYREKLMHAFNYHAALTAWNEAQNYLMQQEPLDPAEITERIPVLEHWLAFFGAPGTEVVAQLQQKLDEQQKKAPADSSAPQQPETQQAPTAATPAAPSESTPAAAETQQTTPTVKQPETPMDATQTPTAQQEADKATTPPPQPDVQKEQPEAPAEATQSEDQQEPAVQETAQPPAAQQAVQQEQPEQQAEPTQSAAAVQEITPTPATPAETAEQPQPAVAQEQPAPDEQAQPEQPSANPAESGATPAPPEQPKPTESTPAQQPAPTESTPAQPATPQQPPAKPDAVQTPVKADDEATWQVQKIFKQADLLETVQSWITARCVELGQIEIFTYPCYGFLVDMMEQTLKETNAVLENTVLTARINDIVPDGLEKLKKLQQSINADLDIAYQNIESHPISLVNPELNRSDLKNILGKIDTSSKPEYIGQAPDGFESIDDPYAKPAPETPQQEQEQPQAPTQPPETPDAKNEEQNENTSSQSTQNGVQRKLSFSFGKKKPTTP